MLTKTDQGRAELRPGHRSLGQRERAVLLLADGRVSESRLAALFEGEGRELVDRLVTQGYLCRTQPAPPPPAAARPTAQHGESFAGTRSLATARMYLFDLSDRLFAPRDRNLADRYRAALREARDAHAMLAVGRELIADVETLGGAQRAAGIRERLERLLPPEITDIPA